MLLSSAWIQCSHCCFHIISVMITSPLFIDWLTDCCLESSLVILRKLMQLSSIWFHCNLAVFILAVLSLHHPFDWLIDWLIDYPLKSTLVTLCKLMLHSVWIHCIHTVSKWAVLWLQSSSLWLIDWLIDWSFYYTKLIIAYLFYFLFGTCSTEAKRWLAKRQKTQERIWRFEQTQGPNYWVSLTPYMC